ISEAVYNCFKPHKLNYELLGNICPHLHWHIFPRYLKDPSVKDPVWQKNAELAKNDSFIPDNNELKDLKENLLFQLLKTEGINILKDFREI
ncbi:MAG: hypothetical protein LH629_05685, partial [Ignavibacteria bacterium]|nr:hypothetical protein [Ignavibacteria bacterium]